MISSYQNNTYCINLDWLQFSVHLTSPEPEIICPDGYRIELCQGNNIFANRALVFDARGAKMLTLLWTPYSKVLPSNLMTCQVANEFLYLDGQGIKWAWDTLQEIVDCTFNAIGRVDFCLDFQGSEQRTMFITNLATSRYYVQARKEGSNWWHELADGRKQTHCLTWGSPKTEIKVKLYHKSREQGVLDGNADNAEKPWIVREWQAAQMDITNVWRLEFSLQGVGQLRWNGQPITLDNLMDTAWISQVYCELYANRYITRENKGRRKGHKNEDPRVTLFPLPLRASHLKWQDAKLEHHDLPAAITLLRSLMRQIDNPAVVASRQVFDYYASTITNVIRDYALEGYFRRTWEDSSTNYFANLWQDVGQGLHTTIASPTRLMD